MSSHDQKSDLERQTEELKAHCAKEEISQVETIEDIGSGINYKKQGLKKLIKEVVCGKVRRVVVSYKDRLVRFGLEILSQIFELCNVELVVLHERETKGFEEELVDDVLAILTVFTSRVYGKRSHERSRTREHAG